MGKIRYNDDIVKNVIHLRMLYVEVGILMLDSILNRCVANFDCYPLKLIVNWRVGCCL